MTYVATFEYSSYGFDDKRLVYLVDDNPIDSLDNIKLVSDPITNNVYLMHNEDLEQCEESVIGKTFLYPIAKYVYETHPELEGAHIKAVVMKQMGDQYLVRLIDDDGGDWWSGYDVVRNLRIYKPSEWTKDGVKYYRK